MTTSPSDPPTDPGLGVSSSPEASEQKNDKIGEHAEITLPDVVPIVDKEHAGKLLLWVGELWIQLHYLVRGVAGTWVEWYLFFVAVSMKNPRISACLLAILVVFTEENYSQHPFLTNIMKYGMHYFDPEAADKIFAEREVDPDPIGKGIKLTIEDATKEYMESSEYRDLQEEVTLYTQYQFKRGTYISTGMVDELRELDAEMTALRGERKARREVQAEEMPTTEVTYSPALAPVAPHRQQEPHGESVVEPPPKEEGVDTEADVPTEVPAEEPAEKEPARKKGRRESKAEQPDPIKKARRDIEKVLEGLPQ